MFCMRGHFTHCPQIRASLTTLTFNVYLLHPTVHLITTLYFYSTHDERLVRGDFQSFFFDGFHQLFLVNRSSPVYAECVRKKKEVMNMMESKLDSGIDR